MNTVVYYTSGTAGAGGGNFYFKTVKKPKSSDPEESDLLKPLD